ncbi:serine protease [uncultured Thermomonospora sp.]|uniref:trypsin-like serine peptidase n=2 Tax=Thermomonospora TaxID=2019 RepID=UPI000CBCAB9D|nr:peptidase [uncultured Thermomonospora sp.]PKK13391.1 MAG: peptidase [Thermomonospora sp. CIF 1]
MRRRFRMPLVVGGLLVLTVPAALLPAWAQGSGPVAVPPPGAKVQALTAADQRAVARYWTPERMRRAVPISLLVGRPARSPDRPPPAAGRLDFPHTGGLWTGGGAVARTTGRVFFTFRGVDAYCSGSAVAGANRSTVITAGHCVKSQGTWHTNWVFVPGYRDGEQPYGVWTARRTFATAQWSVLEDFGHDIGAAVVNALGGRRLVDVVGGQGIAFHQPREQNMYAFGYPVQQPYTGQWLAYCSGRTFEVSPISQAMGMPCNLTRGASGGPWLLHFDESSGTGVITSVNSLGLEASGSRYVFGPYFGESARLLYERAQHS